MENADYLDFDEAVLFLKTTPSTLYKWLQAGKIPGHKLGRQWRFLKDELEIHVSGKGSKINIQKDFLFLNQVLENRKTKKEKVMSANMNQLAEKIIWDAFDHGSRLVHIYPAQGKYEISYRAKTGIEKLASVQEEFFQELDDTFNANSKAAADGMSRRLYIYRDDAEALQVRYQKLETVTGPRVTLSLWQSEKDVLPLEKITSKESEAYIHYKKWLEAKHGLLIVSGANGSGKSTTIYSLINELKNQGRVVFTIEDSVQFIVEGINQVEFKISQQADQFDSIFERVYCSDPDVICLGLSSYYGAEEKIFNAAYRAASTGHLVIIQMDKATGPEALDFFKSHVKYPMDHLLVGISSQKLIEENGKLKCLYDFSR